MNIRVITVLMLLLTQSVLFAEVKHYFYNGSPVYLEQREDKIAVITESGPYSVLNILELSLIHI